MVTLTISPFFCAIGANPISGYDVETVSTPDRNEYRVDMTFTGRRVKLARPIGIGVAIVGILFIFATMTTNVAAHLLPMGDEYLAAMIPAAPDGSEPLSLTLLCHEINDKTISVTGAIKNRTNEPMSNVLAVVKMVDTTGRFPQTVEVPLMPAPLQPQTESNFMTMATLQEKPAGYTVNFRFADGPFIPHKDEYIPSNKDERCAPVTITPLPVTK
jgi:hypothetical protein